MNREKTKTAHQVITLRQFKDKLFSKKGNGGILEKCHVTEQQFVEMLFPRAFLNEPLARQFVNYEGHNNTTRNNIFNGTYHGEVLQTRVSELFIENPEVWREFVTQCTQKSALPSCDQARLSSFLLEMTEQMRTSVDPKLYTRTKKACTKTPGEALAILLLFSMLHTNHTGSDSGRGNIKFLLPVIHQLESLPLTVPTAQDWSYISGCQPFLKKQFQKLVSCPDTEFNEVFQKYSNLFSCVVSVSTSQGDTCLTPPKDWMVNLYKCILSVSSPHVLHIEGPAGTHKNALMQLLFLKLVRACVSDPAGPQIAPFYIDLNFFEKNGLSQTIANPQQSVNPVALITKQFRELLKDFAAFCQQHPERRPLLFIDSIRNYRQAVPLDDLLKRCSLLKNLKNLCYVEDVDTILTGAALKLRPIPQNSWAYVVKLHSVELGNNAQTSQFLKYYSQLYPLPANLRTKLKKFPFYTIDSYQLHLLSKTLDSCQQEYEGNLFQIYEQFCMDYLEYDTSQMEQAAAEAFDFAYTDSSLPVHDYYTTPFWVLLRKHASFLDFFIARFYMRQLEESSKTGNVAPLNMIMPKTITRFITPQINQSIIKEDMVVNLAKEHYRKMKPYAQSEMTYWLGRIKHSNQKLRAVNLLRELLAEQEQKIQELMKQPNNYSDAAKKEDLFLLRGIMVSLTYQGCQDISTRYILSLIDNDLASQINRGFHLEYYGDIPYLPHLESLNYKDDIHSGEKTLKQLLQFCENPRLASHPAFELNLFTICSLIQSRIEVLPPQTSFPLEPYLDRLIKLLQRPTGNLLPQKLAEYYAMILEDCQSVRTQHHNSGPISVWLYRRFNELNHISRTGWVDHEIPNPERIGEHMYSAWLMAFLLLPETCDESLSYDKQAVMRLLLIHDLGERVTGDIPRPKKQLAPDTYAREEDRAMTQLLLKETYPNVGRMDWEYQLWKEWAEDSSFNAKVAKEIDTLQAAYQLCLYLLNYRKNFSEEKIVSWLSECVELKTSVCRTIFRQLILENPAFESLHLGDLVSFPDSSHACQ